MKPILFNNDETDLICDLLADRHDNLKDRLESEEECKLNGHQDTGRGDCANCDQFLPVEDNSDTANEFNLIERIQNKLFSGVHTIHTDADIVMHTGENYLDSLEVSSIRLNNVDYQTTGTGGGCTALTTKVGKVILMITDNAMIPNSIESEVSIGVYDGDELIEISENLDNGKDTVEYKKLQNILAWDGTTIKFKYITEEYLNKIIDNPDSILFRVEWIEGYDNTDLKIVSIDELNSDDWNMSAYHGDSWISEFARLKVGSCIDSYGDGHVKFTRIN